MVTLAVLFAFIGTFLFKPAISAVIDYEPGQVSEGLQSPGPGVVHQGTNFYFKPQLNLPPGHIPSHIEALISLIQQHPNSCIRDNSKLVIDKDKLIQILKQILYPVSDFKKGTSPKIVPEKDKNIEVVKSQKDILPGLLLKNITHKEMLIEKDDNSDNPTYIPTDVIIQDKLKIPPPPPYLPAPVMINNEIKPVTTELVIPEAPVLPPLSYMPPGAEELKSEVESQDPVLPPLSLNSIPPVVEELKSEEPIILEKSKDANSPIAEISSRPIPEKITINAEPEPDTSELLVIPEAPVLPPLSFISPIVEEVKLEEPIILEESKDVYSPVVKEEVKVEVPILEESIEVLPPTIAEISPGPLLESIQPKIANSFVLEEILQPSPYTQTLPPAIIQGIRPGEKLGAFSYVPFISHPFTRVPIKNLMIPKLRLPFPFTNRARFGNGGFNEIRTLKFGDKIQPPYSTSFAHNIVEKRITPNMIFKKTSSDQANIDAPFNVPKRSS